MTCIAVLGHMYNSCPLQGNIRTATTTALILHQYNILISVVYWPRARNLAQFPVHMSTHAGETSISRWGWDFHTVRNGIDPGGRGFRPAVLGIVHR